MMYPVDTPTSSRPLITATARAETRGAQARIVVRQKVVLRYLRATLLLCSFCFNYVLLKSYRQLQTETLLVQQQQQQQQRPQQKTRNGSIAEQREESWKVSRYLATAHTIGSSSNRYTTSSSWNGSGFGADVSHDHEHNGMESEDGSESKTQQSRSHQQYDEEGVVRAPFWDKQLIFAHRSQRTLLVTVLAEDCLASTTTATTMFPTIETLRDVLSTQQEQLEAGTRVAVYLPQTPQSVLFPHFSQQRQQQQLHCQTQLQDAIRTQFANSLATGLLNIILGIVNPLPPRIKYRYGHDHGQKNLQDHPKYTREALQYQARQLQVELDYSLSLDFVYTAEYARQQQSDLWLFLRSNTRLVVDSVDYDYSSKVLEYYEQFHLRMDSDHLTHRLCYASFLQNNHNQHQQQEIAIPTAILMQTQQAQRFSLVLRSLLSYQKTNPNGLLDTFCNEMLWESQVVTPSYSKRSTNNQDFTLPPPLFVFPPRQEQQKEHSTVMFDSTSNETETTEGRLLDDVDVDVDDDDDDEEPLFPWWVAIDHYELGPQSTTLSEIQQYNRTLVTFVVLTASRPTVKDAYIKESLSQLMPLLKQHFYDTQTQQYTASIVLVVCGNTQHMIEQHKENLVEYYSEEIEDGLIDVVSTSLDMYPSLHDLPNNYKDGESRVRWRTKHNMDVSNAFYAAKSRSEYIMLLEDDTAFKEGFGTKLKQFLDQDHKAEASLNNKLPVVMRDGQGGVENIVVDDDYRVHKFSTAYMGFGYSGVLIHDDDALVLSVLHFVLMDEKPCDMFFFGKFMEGGLIYENKDSQLSHMGKISTFIGKNKDKKKERKNNRPAAKTRTGTTTSTLTGAAARRQKRREARNANKQGKVANNKPPVTAKPKPEPIPETQTLQKVDQRIAEARNRIRKHMPDH